MAYTSVEQSLGELFDLSPEDKARLAALLLNGIEPSQKAAETFCRSLSEDWYEWIAGS